MIDKLSEILEKSADLLEQPGKWTIYYRAVDAQGEERSIFNPSAVSWNIFGILFYVSGIESYNDEDDTIDELFDIVCEAAGIESVAGALDEWNSVHSQTEAVAVLRKAAKLAKDKENAQ